MGRRRGHERGLSLPPKPPRERRGEEAPRRGHRPGQRQGTAGQEMCLSLAVKEAACTPMPPTAAVPASAPRRPWGPRASGGRSPGRTRRPRGALAAGVGGCQWRWPHSPRCPSLTWGLAAGRMQEARGHAPSCLGSACTWVALRPRFCWAPCSPLSAGAHEPRRPTSPPPGDTWRRPSAAGRG